MRSTIRNGLVLGIQATLLAAFWSCGSGENCAVLNEQCSEQNPCCTGYVCSVQFLCIEDLPPSGCNQQGEQCVSHPDCCSSLSCLGGKCKSCGDEEDQCNSNEPCCSNHECHDGYCCKATGAKCSSTSECCDGFRCYSGECGAEGSCSVQKESCNDDDDCCGEYLVCNGGKCGHEITCAEQGESCEYSDCCGDYLVCNGGKCGYETTCAELGESCQYSDCCGSMMCNDYNECVCKSHAKKDCSSNDVYWFDGCGNKEEKYEDCSYNEVCESGKCNSTCECTSGPCCDGCDFESNWTECDDLVQYDCTTSCGGEVERKFGTQYCSGSSSSCNGSTDWESWKTFMECQEDWICEADAIGGSCKKYTGNSAKLTLSLGFKTASRYCTNCGNITTYWMMYYSDDCNPEYSSCSKGLLSKDNMSDTLTVPSGNIDLYYQYCFHMSSSDYNNNCCLAKQGFLTSNCNGTPCFCGDWNHWSYDMGCQKSLTFEY